MFITHIGIWKTRNLFRYETFIYLFEFKVFQHEERETHNFFLCWLFHLNPTTCGTPTANYWYDLGELRKSTSFVQAQISTNCFFKFWNPPLPGMTSFTSPVSFHTWDFYCDISIVTSAPLAREHLHSTNPRTKPKGLSLTKPKGKIYKTKNDNIKKSLRNYITKAF